MKPVCFVLPDGHGLGGVTGWSIDMARIVSHRGREALLMEHLNPDVQWEEQIADAVQHIQCHGRHPAWVEPGDIEGYSDAYREALPATFIPNYTEGAYAACADLARRNCDQLRVIGFAHTDQPYYYDLLAHYEPLMSTLVAVSDEVARSLADRLPHRAQDIVCRPYGVAVATELNRAWSRDPSPLTLAFAGRLVQEQKRIADLVPLVENLFGRSVDFRLRIAGSGSEEGQLRSQFEALGPDAQAKVEFVGRIPQDQMPAFWRAADIGILVSDYEGTSIAMLESMAHGCVPVVTDVSGTRAVIRDGQNGFAVRTGDMCAMAQKIAMLAGSRPRLESIGRQAHRAVVGGHSLDDYVDWFDSLVDDAWRAPPRSWPIDRPLLPAVRCGAPKPVPISLWGRCRRFSGKVRRRLNLGLLGGRHSP
jgi:glycosyltransferase involved in cell wall biosynthesis